jgi:ubiquitin-conjugating enzyme E2 Z
MKVYFGKPMTKWDGGMFSIKLVFPPTFPDFEQPRVRIMTPFFHANVTTDGIPFYRVTKSDVVQSHIEAIIDIFEKDMNPDPTCILDRKCADMYWRSGQEGRNEYNKMIRRIVTRSVEYDY